MQATERVSKRAVKSLRLILREMLLDATQDQVAERLGVSQNWVCQHVRNGRPPRTQKRKLPGIAKGLGITLKEAALLCRGAGTENSK